MTPGQTLAADRATNATRSDDRLHVCLTCIELFGFGMYGGFGRATRTIGRELVRRGVNVTVVVPQRANDSSDPVEVDGMRVRAPATSYRPIHHVAFTTNTFSG